MIVKDNDGRAIGDFVSLCNEYYACLTFSTKGLELEAIKLKRVLATNRKPNPTLLISSQEPTLGEPVAGRVKLRSVIENSKKDGPYSDLLHKSVLVSLYADWEEYYRDRVAIQIGASDKKNVRCDLIGDIRLIRNWIVHRRSRPENDVKNLKILKWDLKEDVKFVITHRMFEELMENINTQLYIYDVGNGSLPDYKELQDCFENVKNSVNAALGHYQIWFTLRGRGKAIDEYINDMNDVRYVDFFRATNIAHYKLMFIETGCIFDADDRADNFRRLKKLMKENEFQDLSNKFEKSIKPYSGLVKNILTIRSKLIAHKDFGVEPLELYENNGIEPNKIKELLKRLAELMKELESHLNNGASWNSTGVTDRWETATFALLEVVRKGRHS